MHAATCERAGSTTRQATGRQSRARTVVDEHVPLVQPLRGDNEPRQGARALIRDSHDLRHWVGFEHTILLHLALLGERLGLGLHMTQPCVSHMMSHASRTCTTHGPCMDHVWFMCGTMGGCNVPCTWHTGAGCPGIGSHHRTHAAARPWLHGIAVPRVACRACSVRRQGTAKALRTACKGGAETPPHERQPNARDGLGETPLEGTVLTRQFADAGRPRRGVRGP